MNKEEEVNIVIGGDIYPKGQMESHFINGDASKIFNDTLSIIENSDYTVVNLECPLVNSETPILKDGNNLRADIRTTNGIKSSGINAVNLSNNHILDHGEQGLKSTLKILSEKKIECFGANSNLVEAAKPLIVDIKGKKFAFLGVAEHEFSIATDSKYGANPLNLTSNIRVIRELKSKVDYIIMLYHGGKEHYAYPTPKQQDISRFLLRKVLMW